MTRFLKMTLAGALCALAFSSVASAKTVAVDISLAGFVPANVTLNVGDEVTFTNKDTSNHQVVCQTCPFTSPVLKPGETFSFTFTKVGKFTYSDPLNKNKKGTATVKALPAAVTLTASLGTVTYGAGSTLSGTVTTQQSGLKVDILQQLCGETAFKVVTTVTTTAGGAFGYLAHPTKNTTYQARYKPAGVAAVTSAAVVVKVRPRLALRRLGLGRFSMQVTASESFVGKAVLFQRYVATTAKWRTLKTVILKTQLQSSVPLSVSYVAGSSIKLKLKRGFRVRAVLAPAQAGTCFLAATSATIKS
jgi:plastocyanin